MSPPAVYIGDDSLKGWFPSQNLSYFDPDNEAENFVELVEDKIAYHKVFSFTARVQAKCLGVVEGHFAANKVATQLDHYLKGRVELWYMNDISNKIRSGFIANIENWCEILEKRFRISQALRMRDSGVSSISFEMCVNAESQKNSYKLS